MIIMELSPQELVRQARKTFAFLESPVFTGLTSIGADVNLNVSSNFNTNINTGNSTGTVNVGSSTNAQTVNIGTGSGVADINIGTGNTASNITIGSGGSPITAVIYASVNTSFLAVLGRSNNIQTYSVPGAKVGANVIVNPVNPITTSGIFMNYARVSAAGTVEVGWNTAYNGTPKSNIRTGSKYYGN